MLCIYRHHQLGQTFTFLCYLKSLAVSILSSLLNKGLSRLKIRTNVHMYDSNGGVIGACSLQRWSVAADKAQVGKGRPAQPSLIIAPSCRQVNPPPDQVSHTSPPSCLTSLLEGQYFLYSGPSTWLSAFAQLPFPNRCSSTHAAVISFCGKVGT